MAVVWVICVRTSQNVRLALSARFTRAIHSWSVRIFSARLTENKASTSLQRLHTETKHVKPTIPATNHLVSASRDLTHLTIIHNMQARCASQQSSLAWGYRLIHGRGARTSWMVNERPSSSSRRIPQVAQCAAAGARAERTLSTGGSCCALWLNCRFKGCQFSASRQSDGNLISY
jgi:hypothetical protein